MSISCFPATPTPTHKEVVKIVASTVDNDFDCWTTFKRKVVKYENPKR